ncbi:MAG: hypothetical protein CMH56_00200 [Myxococcales bacterium]|nr:hypothetical protein [Myxococcales bacterium]
MPENLAPTPYRPFEHALPTQVWSGPGSSFQLQKNPILQKAQRVVLITDAGLQKTENYSPLLESLGEKCAWVESEVSADSDVHLVNAMASRIRKDNIDTLVALGGGSVMDTAKAVAVVVQKGGSIEDHVGFKRIGEPLMPLICIPTTAGTGSECTQFAVIKNHQDNKKLIFVDDALCPAGAILDPKWITSVPKHTQKLTGVDALTHAVEAIAAKTCNPIGEALALRAANMIVSQRALLNLLEDDNDIHAAEQMLLAANLAGQAISTCMLGACHAMAHALGALHGIPHGQANGICLATVMKLNQEKAQTAYAQLGTVLGGTGDAPTLAQYAIERVSWFIHEEVGIPTTLSEVGIEPSHVNALADEALSDMDLLTNPVRIKTHEEMAALFKQLL